MRDEWKTFNLGEICSPKQWKTIGSNELKKSGVPVFGANGFIGFYDEPNHLEDTVVITCRGATCGEVTVVPGPSYITGNAMCLDDVNEDIVLKSVLAEAIRLTGTERIISGSAQPQIVRGSLLKFKVKLPPRADQPKIAEILETWGEAIERLESLHLAKLRRHTALTYALVLGSLQLDRFRTANARIPYRWFALPAEWGSEPIGKLAREVSERNGSEKELEVLSCTKHDGFVRSLEYFKKQVFSTDLSGYKKIWRGDFGFPSNHVEEGSIGLQSLTEVGLVSPIYTVFRFLHEKIDADYAFAVLKTGLYRHIFEVSTSASVDRRGSLRWSEFSKIPFPVPSLVEQKAIAEVLRTSQAEIDTLATEIEVLQQQKRGLMQKLLTGEWRVSADIQTKEVM